MHNIAHEIGFRTIEHVRDGQVEGFCPLPDSQSM